VKESLKNLVSYPIYNQIWLNCIIDDRQFSYITNMKKENPELDSLGLSLWPLSFKNDATTILWPSTSKVLQQFPFQQSVG
jgi:hypothetical protein